MTPKPAPGYRKAAEQGVELPHRGEEQPRGDVRRGSRRARQGLQLKPRYVVRQSAASVQQDDAEAGTWYRKVAEQGHIDL